MSYILFFLVLFASVSFADDQDRLKFLLNVDRFTAYVDSWAGVQRGKGRPDLAKAMQEFGPQEYLSIGIDFNKLGDAKNYDDLILQILTKHRSDLKATAEQVNWGYNFFKMKMNEGFLLNPKGAVTGTAPDSPLPASVTDGPLPTGDGSQILLNVDDYSANRTTRAIFWEAAEVNRRIEMFVGTAGSFREEIGRRGSKVLALVATQARNYNPIYLIQDPGEKSFHYAITEIAGRDRLSHLQLEASVLSMKWTGRHELPPMFTVESVEAKIARETEVLTSILKVLPRSDHVVIGQKGAFERTFQSLGKIHSLIDLFKTDPALFDKAATKFMSKAGLETNNSMVEFVMKYASDIDNLYEKQTPALNQKNLLIPDSEIYTMDRASYQMADRMTIDSNGKPHRWRLFSNIWGDEILPIARALKANGYKDISYIGTAGALPSSGLKPGDLVMPKTALNFAGKPVSITPSLVPSKAKTIESVAHVGSPFEETTLWLASADKAAQAVEVETKYLASVFDGKDDKVNVMLLISDVVGSEDENLSTASSSVRRGAQINAVSTVINSGNVVHLLETKTAPNGIASWIKEFVPNRDPASALQLHREAMVRGISTKAELASFIKTQKSFTTGKLESFLDGADFRLATLAKKAELAGALPEIWIATSFVDGRFNPASGPVAISLHTESAEVKASLDKILSDLQKSDKDFEKFLKITTSSDSVVTGFTKLPKVFSADSPTLMSLYQKSALSFGGLAPQETRTGALKFVKVTDAPNPLVASAFYKPSADVEVILKQMRTLPEGLDITTSIPGGDGFIVRQVVVESLADGELAQIVPVLDDSSRKLVVELRITKEGLKSPAVIAEEYAHLRQITSEGYGFSHPYQWAEAVANARRGSLPSLERLARMEVEAMNNADALVTALSTGEAYYGSTPVDITDPKMKEFIDARRAQAEDMYAKVNKDYLADQSKRKKAWEQMKTVFNNIEKQPEKLNDLILKNDRAGVRKLIETYLPWDMMEPSETNAWRNWLDAMVKPDPSRMTVVFRGMDDYPVLKNPSGGQPGVVSTVLAKNQGNYNRRLRSLNTMRSRFGTSVYYSDAANWEGEIKNQPSVLVEMKSHAGDPVGSPFLSVSDNDIATRFGSTERMAIKIDDRRLVYNPLGLMDEKERLIPLVIFPDEVLVYEGKANGFQGRIDDTAFQGKVTKALGRPLTPEEITWSISQNDFYQQGYERMKSVLLDATNLPVVKGSCALSTGCDCVYKTLGSLLTP